MPINVLDLNSDVWFEILKYFLPAKPDKDEPCRVRQTNDEDHPTLQSLRLVCHRLQQLVDPLLCPVIRIELNKQSLAKLEGLSRNPLIPSSVRRIEISLTFRLAVLSRLPRYKAYVHDLVREARQTLEMWHHWPMTPEDQSHFDRAIARYRQLEYAFRRGRNKSKSGLHRTLLHECFRSYILQQTEQHEIIHDGSFVNTIATAVSRFRSGTTLMLADSCSEMHASWLNAESLLDLADDESKLRRHMTAARGWRQLEALDNDSLELSLVIRMLSEIPIKCDQSGAPLKGLIIKAFPFHRGFDYIFSRPTTTKDPGSAEEDFLKACRKLELFVFNTSDHIHGATREETQRQPIAPQDSLVVERYLGAACSSPQLRCLTLQPDSFMLRSDTDDPDSMNPDFLFDVGPIVGRLQTTRIANVTILDATIAGHDLESLVRRLHTVKRFTLNWVSLRECTYSNLASIFREGLARNESCEVSFADVFVGELGDEVNLENRPRHAPAFSITTLPQTAEEIEKLEGFEDD